MSADVNNMYPVFIHRPFVSRDDVYTTYPTHTTIFKYLFRLPEKEKRAKKKIKDDTDK